MKVKEFEKAIDALGRDIVIDEMKLRHSYVRQVNGHKGDLHIVWDEYGRAYSYKKEYEKDIFLTQKEDGKFHSVVGIPLKREIKLDLNIKQL
ncbi:3-mercaptopyruvate sulfurtransferase [Prevotella pallens]|uniref:3-mercaptopyruvate sulfurtransferase n=1 Tax=Prevotella pallens TaxID=60133 RepID=UPI001CB64F99|nr:3-mercaptopyruvate sulfurtransferase [Prevotella pallens]MBF1462985.1 3-mercaptopyruvate sulfurtransferase [Prevotella pallens]